MWSLSFVVTVLLGGVHVTLTELISSVLRLPKGFTPADEHEIIIAQVIMDASNANSFFIYYTPSLAVKYLFCYYNNTKRECIS